MIIRQYYIHIILSNIRTRDWPILKSLYLYIYIYYQLLYNGGFDHQILLLLLNVLQKNDALYQQYRVVFFQL